jgi:hypothetical protein
MPHDIEHHAAKAKKILDALAASRRELEEWEAERDREHQALTDKVTSLQGQLSEAESAAANDGHSVGELHEAVAAIPAVDEVEPEIKKPAAARSSKKAAK